MRPARVWLSAAAVAVAAALVAPARAGGFADREAARSLSGKAYEAFEARRYARAIDLFQQAEARFHAPPHLLYTARAQVKLGLLLEARATFERVVAEKLAADAPAPFREAQVSARAELTEVEALTPSMVVAVSSLVPPGARVLVDGAPLAPGDLGRPLPRNPGEHALIVEAPGMARIERKVKLTAGGADEQVTLAPAAPAPPPSVVPAVITLSVGAAGLCAGTVGAILAHQASPAQATPPRVVEVVGFTAGGLGAGAGVILVTLWAKAPPPSAGAARAARAAPVRLDVGFGPTAVRLGGSF